MPHDEKPVERPENMLDWLNLDAVDKKKHGQSALSEEGDEFNIWLATRQMSPTAIRWELSRLRRERDEYEEELLALKRKEKEQEHQKQLQEEVEQRRMKLELALSLLRWQMDLHYKEFERQLREREQAEHTLRRSRGYDRDERDYGFSR